MYAILTWAIVLLFLIIRQALSLESIKSHTWLIRSCSAVTGDGLLPGIDWVVGDVAGRVYYSSTVSDDNPISDDKDDRRAQTAAA